MPRPTKYTPDVVDRIVKAIGVGATYQLACKYAGISYDTFDDWRRDKIQFLHAIEKAEGDAAARWLGRIEEASQNGQWQAAAWKLERRYPQEYGRMVLDQNVNLRGTVLPMITEVVVSLQQHDNSTNGASETTDQPLLGGGQQAYAELPSGASQGVEER